MPNAPENSTSTTPNDNSVSTSASTPSAEMQVSSTMTNPTRTNASVSTAVTETLSTNATIVTTTTSVSVTVNVEAQVKVYNKDYNSSLEDLSSDYSQEIQNQFKKQMEVVYRDVPGYFDVEILRMRKGSIIVEHRVIFQVQVENNEEIIQKQMNTITDEVRNSLAEIGTNGECVRNSGPDLCFDPLPNPIISSVFSLNDPCKNITDPKYHKYYHPYQVNGTLRCVTKCFKGAPDSMNCFNGVCQVFEMGPHCICNNLDMFWYLDSSYCKLPVQKNALGFGLALAVLFVINIILVIFLIRAKRKNSRNSWSVDGDTWCGEDADEEWIPPGGLNIMNKTVASSWDEAN
ncbi:mucin-12-like [Erythrolamprus reginae]|uniref:mucin-12-like n=1 Tax=Erythrolamprus reginae TaxID=121349 RepID=UPI00396CCB5F